MRKGAANILLLLFILALQGCEPNRQTSTTNRRHYTSKPTKSADNPDNDLLEVNAVAYHVSDSVTMVYLEVKNENLAYKRPDTTLAFYSEMKISYRLLPDANSKRVLDSASYTLLDRAGDQVNVRPVLSRFPVKAAFGGNYFLDIQVLDMNKKIKYHEMLNIYKQSRMSSQNFLVTLNGNVAFQNNFLKDDQVVVRFSNDAVSQATVDCFSHEFGPAKPPFSTRTPDPFRYQPDSSFVLRLNADQYVLTMPVRGFYHVRTDTASLDGLTLYSYDKTFPGVSNSDEMINCTRYIMNKTEFEDCKTAEDKKAAIDKFWLTIGGSNERARELIKSYYGRVKDANKKFSNYTQGWKSDRGMVYIIFGPPTSTYRTSKDEVWVYGTETTTSASRRFIFDKERSPFTDNDYVLERSQFYQDPWYRSVDYWRQGHVHLDGSNEGRR